MPGIAADFRAYLMSNPLLTNLVGDRIHKGVMPQQSRYPAIWFQRIGIERATALDKTTDGLKRHRFALEVLAEAPDEAEEICDQLDLMCGEYNGPMGSRRVQGIFLEDVDEDYVPRNDASDLGIEVVEHQIVIWST